MSFSEINYAPSFGNVMQHGGEVLSNLNAANGFTGVQEAGLVVLGLMAVGGVSAGIYYGLPAIYGFLKRGSKKTNSNLPK